MKIFIQGYFNKNHLFSFVTGIFSLSSLFGCHSGSTLQSPGWNELERSENTSNPSSTTPQHFYDFCTRQGIDSSLDQRSPWSAEMVQKVLTDLIGSPEVKSLPWVAYPVAYRRMTAARDKERCDQGVISGNKVHNDDLTRLGSQLINHHLADIMTRWLVYETKTCSQLPLNKLPSNGLCGLMAREVQGKYDTLSAAMATTAVYIGPHIALSLAAVGADDAFWDSFPDPKTRRTTEPLHTIPAARLVWLKTYKPQFDLFNGFLANNLKTVADALHEAKLLRNQNLNNAVHVAQLGIFQASLFGNIRDRAYKAAIDYLKGTLITKHPMLVEQNQRLVLQYGQFDFNAPLPKAVLDVESFALNAVASPATRAIYQNVLGGRPFDEWVQFSNSTH